MNDHLVCFYEDDALLVKKLGHYIGTAIKNGNTAIAIATKDHLQQLNKILHDVALLDSEGHVSCGHYQAVEAEQQLSSFMENGMPVEARFHRNIGNLIQLATKRHQGDIYVFGEMVAIVSNLKAVVPDMDRYAAAIEIERYFNRLIEHVPFTLLCAYPMSSFPRASDSAQFKTICELHSGLLPVEACYANHAHDTAQRELAMSEQRAYSLRAEAEDRNNIEQVIQKINIDDITGLPNRNLFHDRLEIDIKRAQRGQLPLALLFIDLDHFKEINDTLGHEAGDTLLKEVGKRLARHVRLSDTVTRLGGDEFTICLGELKDLDRVADIANKVLSDLAKPIKLNGNLAYISASIGIALYPQDATNASDLLRNTDQAMYEAKEKGRNCFIYFKQSMQMTAQLHMCLSGDLRQALDQQQLCVHYQPIIDLTTGAMRKAEALIRWEHPQYGAISPVEFIPIAEHSGLIVSLGNWVIDKVAQDLSRWHVHLPTLTVSINISPVQLHSANGGRAILNKLVGYHLAGQADNDGKSPVELEITEGLLLSASPAVTEQLEAFQSAGVMIALDDFGTGYSSLSYLRRFKLNYLKIDRSFVVNLESDIANQALCEAIIIMAHKLKMQVIAEGVENTAQESLLREAGCDYTQGFLYGEALPPEQFESRFMATVLRPSQKLSV
jgi:diguanylate cyclase (GGDEF)-like protein